MEVLIQSGVSIQSNLKIIDAIYSRRAVRKYTDQKVDSDTVQALIDLAIQAPSAMNKQPWAFSIIQDVELLRELSGKAKELLRSTWKDHSEHAKESFEDPNFDIFYGATTLITICAEREGFQPTGDCYLAAENLMLGALAFGLATCPIGFARDILQTEDFRKRLSIAKKFIPVLPIIVGYSRDTISKSPRKPPQILSWKPMQRAHSAGPQGNVL